ncbi:hypothetical protein [Paractinoplanes toevensis]|uniref:Uncharacterized protein n=1 Tax=Paractinoplanes toevensis TaxID=571911 RepID=A0A919TGP7_9ACTN|nr:hypothetical protein [Actinoplanes toevensis]GIM93641.1 hypothetical protein Ato02nite_054340 [Actinoplanes toevensis]
MSVALLTRTAVSAAYLLALLLNGRADLTTGVLAAALVAVWVVPQLRDRRLRRSPAPDLSVG